MGRKENSKFTNSSSLPEYRKAGRIAKIRSGAIESGMADHV